MELFEQIPREYELGWERSKGVARKLGVHRRMVRQALTSAVPPERRQWQRRCPKLDQIREFIDAILEQDRPPP